jgi:EAL domain-containing protein (putative c-di-GMP-specific phosphodiesterase class I)
MFFSVNQLKESLGNHAFIPYYQPIINNHGGKIIGYEILARWKHPTEGLLNAECFINSIESNDMTNKLTRELMQSVISQADTLPNQGGMKLLLTINTTLSQVMDSVFRQYLIKLHDKLNDMSMVPVFEITEREDIRNFPGAAAVFSSLTQQGMIFAIDDFCTGYADESLLDVTHSRFIKIDRSFTAQPDNSVIRYAVALARQIGARVIAEGVENAEQMHWLQDSGVDYLQGYFCGMPVSGESFCDSARLLSRANYERT